MLTRREALRAFATGAATAATAACAPSAGPSAPAGAAPQIKRGGTLRYASATDLLHLEVYNRLQAATDMKYQAVDNLTQLGDDFQPKPMLAESWEFSPDNKQLKLNLRKGVTFHTGRELTSEDVKYSFLRPRDPKNTNIGATLKNASAWMTDIQTPDKNTVVVRFDAPRFAIFNIFEDWPVVDRQILEGPDANKVIGGTGPFKFVEWVPATSVKFVRNPNWWGPDKQPYLDGVDCMITGDPQQMVVALESGALDAITIPPLRDAKRLSADPNYVLIDNKKLTGQTHEYYVNVTAGLTANKKFRQALAWTVDRQRFVDNVMLGLGEPTVLRPAPGTTAYNAEKNKFYSFDLDKARSLLREAGYSGDTLLMQVDGTRAEAVVFGQLWKDDLAKVGVKTDLVFINNPQRVAAVAAKTHRLIVSGTANGNLEYVLTMQSYYPANTTSNLYSDPKLADLVVKVSAEVDVTRRKALYDQIHDIFLDEAFELEIARRWPTLLATSKLKGAKFRVNEGVAWAPMWLDR